MTIFAFKPYQPVKRFVASPVRQAKATVNAMYSRNFFIPRTIFTAPRFVILVAGPVIIKAAALPMLMPSESYCIRSGIVPPPQAYSGTPTVAAISTPKPSFLPNNLLTNSAGT